MYSLNKGMQEMFESIKSEEVSFPSPVWDSITDSAKVYFFPMKFSHVQKTW